MPYGIVPPEADRVHFFFFLFSPPCQRLWDFEQVQGKRPSNIFPSGTKKDHQLPELFFFFFSTHLQARLNNMRQPRTLKTCSASRYSLSPAMARIAIGVFLFYSTCRLCRPSLTFLVPSTPSALQGNAVSRGGSKKHTFTKYPEQNSRPQMWAASPPRIAPVPPTPTVDPRAKRHVWLDDATHVDSIHVAIRST